MIHTNKHWTIKLEDRTVILERNNFKRELNFNSPAKAYDHFMYIKEQLN